MKTYIVRQFERRPHKTVRVKVWERTIALPDHIEVGSYIIEHESEWIADPMSVDVYDETGDGPPIWESQPPQS